MNRSTRLAAAAAALTLATPITFAQNATDTSLHAVVVHSREVTYSRAELTTDAGAKRVYDRLSRASRAVCPPVEARSARGATSAATCRKEAMDRAVEDIASARLTAVHLDSTGPANLAKREAGARAR
jgi:UrcA family protein